MTARDDRLDAALEHVNGAIRACADVGTDPDTARDDRARAGLALRALVDAGTALASPNRPRPTRARRRTR